MTEVEQALAELERITSESALVPAGSTGVVLVSGGADSACAAAGLAELVGRENVVALSLNYGLRAESDRDEDVCRALCDRLGIELEVERPALDAGNVQAAAREARYAAAERLRARRGMDWIATGHTRTDQAETVLYRLAVSPGRRGLLGMAPRRGRLIRPLVAVERERIRELARRAQLPFADDESNADPRFARNRIRAEALPALRQLSPAAERNIAETRAELAEEAELLVRVVAEALEAAGAGEGATAVRVEALDAMEPALRRSALRVLAERAARRDVALGRARAAELLELARSPEGGRLDLGGGLRVICEQGFVAFSNREPEEPPAEQLLPLPGSCRFGRWELTAELLPAPVDPEGPDRAMLDAGLLGDELLVRSWRDGDRMHPLGLDGTKSLQDLFSDGRVPRSLRHSLPVVTAGDQIAWVAGVAVSERFKLSVSSDRVAVLDATLAGPSTLRP